MLNDLKYNLEKQKIIIPTSGSNKDATVACRVIDILFKYVNICLKEDRSKIRINKLEKSFIQSLIGQRTVEGLKNYVTNLNDEDLKSLLDEMEKELNKRQVQFNKVSI